MTGTNTCAECGSRNADHGLLCAPCRTTLYPEPTKCGECVVCRSDCAEIAPCLGEGRD